MNIKRDTNSKKSYHSVLSIRMFHRMICSLVIAFQPCLYGNNSSIPEHSEILSAQKRILYLFAHKRGDYDAYKIEEESKSYIDQGYLEIDWNYEILKNSVGKEIANKLLSCTSRQRKRILRNSKSEYAIGYDDLNKFFQTRQNFDDLVRKYLSIENETIKRDIFNNIISKLFSAEEISILTNHFSNTETLVKRLALLKLFREERSLLSMDYLWKFLIHNISLPIRNEILSTLRAREQFDKAFIETLLKLAIEKDYRDLIDSILDFIGNEHWNWNSEATNMLAKYMTPPNPSYMIQIIGSKFRGRIPKSVEDILFIELEREDFSEKQREIVKALSFGSSNLMIRKRLFDLLESNNHKSRSLCIINNFPSLANENKINCQGAINRLTEIAHGIADEEIKKAMQTLVDKINKMQQEKNERVDLLGMVILYLKSYTSIDQEEMTQKQTEMVNGLIDNAKELILEYEEKNIKDERIIEIKTLIKKLKP